MPLAGFIFFREKKNDDDAAGAAAAALPSTMSSDDVPLDDPLSASALLDVRVGSLFSHDGGQGGNRDSLAKERERANGR